MRGFFILGPWFKQIDHGLCHNIRNNPGSVGLEVAELPYRQMSFQSQNMMMTGANAQIGRAIAFVFMASGGLVCIGGCIWFLHTAWFVAHATRADGQVIRMDASQDNHGTMYRPVYTFSDLSGTIHTQACLMSSSDYSYEVGEKVTIIYNPASPKHSNIDSFMTVWFGPLALSVFGVLFGGFAGGWLFLWNRAIRNRGIPSAG
jgi:hypothetical protein